MKTKVIVTALCVLMQGCSKVDDYMLGKDNTPQPKELKQIDSKVTVAQKWSVPVGKAHKSNGYLKQKPVARNGIIYATDSSGLVTAINQHNGKTIWSTQISHSITTGPSVADNFLVLGTSASSLILLDKSNGKQLWEAKIPSDVLSPPAIAHKKIIAKTIDGKVFTFDALTGKQLWTADHGSPSLVLKASSSPVVLNNVVLVGFSDGKMDAMDIDTGRLMWQRSIAYSSGSSDVERLVDIDSDPIVQDGIAYLASYQGYIGALSLDDGQFIWRKPGSVYKNMVLSGSTLYLTDSNDIVWSLDKRTGHVNWKQTSLKARGLTEPVLIGTQLVVADKTGYVHIIGTQTGELLARSQLPAGVSNSPTVVGGNLYVLTDNGMLNQLSVS